MDSFSISDLRRLTVPQTGPCVTIYLPTHAAGIDDQQDALRLKNLVGEAERLLTERGLRAPDAKKLLDPVRSLPADAAFWDKRSQGLAVFLAPGALHRFRVPLPVDETVTVNQRFQVKPLLPLVGGSDRFFLLALSQKRVRFFEGGQVGLREVAVEGLPRDMAQVLNYDASGRGHPVHPTGRGEATNQAGVLHGQGAERDTSKDDLAQYFRRIDAALRPVLRDQRAPLLLAGVQYKLPLYRELASYPHIGPAELPGNPDHLSEHELHERAWPLVKPHLEKDQREAAAKYRQLAGTGKTSDDVRQVVPAACSGQIETLFVDRAAHAWGVFDAGQSHVDLHPERQPGDDDLLDFAAVQTLLNRGAVFAVSREESPAAPVAAVFRY